MKRPAPRAIDHASRLTGLFTRASHLVNKNAAGESLGLMNETGLTLPQMVALFVLQHHGAMTVTGIAAALKLSLAATSGLVDRLVQARLVDRAEDETDRRQKRVALNAPGRQLLEKLHAARGREISGVVARFSPELRGQLEAVLARAIAELSDLDAAGSRRETSAPRAKPPHRNSTPPQR